MMQANTPAVLTTGVEIWSAVDGSMVRQSALPSIGDLDKLIGQANGRDIGRLVEGVCASRMPRIVPLQDGALSVLLWPVIDREAVSSVVSIYLQPDNEATMGAEIWSGRPGRSELCLGEVCYSGLDRFAKLSPFIQFPKGSGLPGRTWDAGFPQVIAGLGKSLSFMRASGAEAEGLDIGFALPCIDGSSLQAVALLLSGNAVPIARGFETWLPTQQGGSLRLQLHESAYVDADALAKASKDLSVPAGDTWVGRAWATRQPTVVCDTTGDALERRGAKEGSLTCGLAIPIIVLDDVAAVAVLMW